MKKLIIVGAGDLGKELASMIEEINRIKPSYLIMGYLDDDPGKIGTRYCGYDVLGNTGKLDEYADRTDICAAVTLQNGWDRKRVVENLARFESWDTIVHPKASVSATAKLGRGCLVYANAVISADTELKGFNICYFGSILCNDCEVEQYASLMTGVLVSDRARIGEAAYLASGARVFPSVTLGKRVRVSVGATVARSYPDDAVVSERGLGRFFK